MADHLYARVLHYLYHSGGIFVLGAAAPAHVVNAGYAQVEPVHCPVSDVERAVGVENVDFAAEASVSHRTWCAGSRACC